MLPNTIGSPSLMNQAILRKIAKANATGGNVSLEQPVTDYAAGKSAADADALKFATDLNFKKEILAQDEKQFLTRLLAARDDLATWSKQNDLATLISAANMPVSGFAAFKQSERQDNQDETVKTILGMDRANNSLRTASVEEQNKLMKATIAEILKAKPPTKKK